MDAVSVYRVGADGAEPFCSFGLEARDGDLPRAVWLGWLPLSLVDFAGPGIAQVGDAWLTAPSAGSGASRPPFPATSSPSTKPPPSWPRAAADPDVLWTAGGGAMRRGAGCWAAPAPR